MEAPAPVPQPGSCASQSSAPADAPALPRSSSSTSQPGEPALVDINNNSDSADDSATPPRDIRWGLSEEEDAKYVAGRHQKIPLAQIRVDTGLVFGQPRPLDLDRVNLLVRRFGASPLRAPVTNILLVQEELGKARYVVLGGQHTCRALKALSDQVDKDRSAPPEWLTFVFADVLKAGTPQHLCRKAAGFHQMVQTGAQPLSLHHWCRSFLNPPPNARTLHQKMKCAVEHVGYERLDSAVCFST